ncbi:MAG: hypothetical protein AAF517_22275, partial [Planctomycetota bacterium]
DFHFADGNVTELGPDEFVLVVKSLDDFQTRYDTFDLQIAGEYSGRLSNSGERITFNYGGNSAILSFEFLDAWAPLSDGIGHSMVIVDPLDSPDTWGLAASWRESNEIGGSPGRSDGGPPPGGRQRVGDSNQDGIIDISDPISLLLRLFEGGGGELPCEGDIDSIGNVTVLDSSGDEQVDISDALYLVNYLFHDGPAPVLGDGSCVRVDGCSSSCQF